MTRSDLYYADEAFFTGTAAEVTPIREIDDRAVGSGDAGTDDPTGPGACFRRSSPVDLAPYHPLAGIRLGGTWGSNPTSALGIEDLPRATAHPGPPGALVAGPPRETSVTPEAVPWGGGVRHPGSRHRIRPHDRGSPCADSPERGAPPADVEAAVVAVMAARASQFGRAPVAGCRQWWRSSGSVRRARRSTDPGATIWHGIAHDPAPPAAPWCAADPRVSASRRVRTDAMKIVRVRLPGDEIAYGVAEPEGIRVHQGTPFVAWEPTETVIPFDEAHLLAPVFPTKVVCVGRNYVDHAAERGAVVPDEPVIFLKPATSVIGPGAAIVLPPEAERGAPRGRTGRGRGDGQPQGGRRGRRRPHPRLHRGQRRQRSRPAEAGTDSGPGPRGSTPSARSVRRSRPRSIRSVFGSPARSTASIRQDGNTDDMVFGVAEIFAFVTRVMTLLPGDVILTGTPAGVGPIHPGDRVEVEIERIGSLINPVVAGS